jgi:subtilase family serine protease
MVRHLRCRSLAALAAVVAGVAASPAHAAVLTRAPSGIPAGARELGAVAADATVRASVALAPRDPAALATYAQAVSTPGSALYHRYLTVGQFAQRFAPSLAQVAAVRASLRAHGLIPGVLSANRLVIPVTGRAATVQSAFSTSLRRFALPTGQTGVANTDEPSVDSGVAGLVQGVVGLDTLAPTAPRPHVIAHASAGSAGCAAARSASVADASNTTSQIAARYGLSTLYAAGITGRHVTIAVYELEPFSAADIAAFRSCFHSGVGVTTVRVDGGAGAGSGSGEAAMDLEDIIGLAPQAAVRVYQGPASGVGAYDTYARIVSDDVAQVVTTSWGLCEAFEGAGSARAESTLFQEAAVQGQTILASTGDQGSDDCSDHSQAVDDPASQPWVTGVGATSIRAAGEDVWNNTYGATGGGVSRLWPRPAYQASVAQPQSSITCGSAGPSCREVPDVSVDGDPDTGYVVYYDGAWTTMGGTSISTPTWAAIAALADSSPACAGRPVGFANPALYALARSAYAADFGDVTVGSNGYDQVAGFEAGTGYDMASGLGTPDAGSLVPALCGDPLTPARAKASTARPRRTVTLMRLVDRVSPVGTRVRVRVRARDGRSPALRYAASGLPPGLRIAPGTGVISGRPTRPGTTRVTVRVTDSAGATVRAVFRWRIRAVGR